MERPGGASWPPGPARAGSCPSPGPRATPVQDVAMTDETKIEATRRKRAALRAFRALRPAERHAFVAWAAAELGLELVEDGELGRLRAWADAAADAGCTDPYDIVLANYEVTK